MYECLCLVGEVVPAGHNLVIPPPPSWPRSKAFWKHWIGDEGSAWADVGYSIV